MNDTYNYCTRCGDELDDEIAQAYADGDSELPPLCRTCQIEMATGIVRPMVEWYPEAVESVIEAFRPLAKALAEMQIGEKSSVSETSDSDPRDDGSGNSSDAPGPILGGQRVSKGKRRDRR